MLGICFISVKMLRFPFPGKKRRRRREEELVQRGGGSLLFLSWSPIPSRGVKVKTQTMVRSDWMRLCVASDGPLSQEKFAVRDVSYTEPLASGYDWKKNNTNIVF